MQQKISEITESADRPTFCWTGWTIQTPL